VTFSVQPRKTSVAVSVQACSPFSVCPQCATRSMRATNLPGSTRTHGSIPPADTEPALTVGERDLSVAADVEQGMDHGQVEASRARLFPQGKGGMMISAARDLMSEQPSTRPDVPESAVPDPIDLAHDDVLLNSLCQFDILYCLILDPPLK